MKHNISPILSFLSDFVLEKSGVKVLASSIELETAFLATFLDRRVWNDDVTLDAVFDDIISYQVDLAVFIYRLGSSLSGTASDGDLKKLHGWSRRDCGCEIYFSTQIDAGLRIVHGLGTVVGSRHRIGRCFTIYQGVTVGHRSSGEAGSIIEDNVTLFTGSSVIGSVTIGENSTIGAHCLVTRDVSPGTVVSLTRAKAASEP